MQKIRNGPGRSRKLWPNVRYADTLETKDPRFGTVSSRTFLTQVLRREDTNLDFCKETSQRRLIQKIFLKILVKKVENV